MKVFLILLLLPFGAHAEGHYQIRELSDREIQQSYMQVLLDACRNADRDWKTSAFNPATGYWGDGVSAGNQGIRAVAGMVLACGTLIKYDGGLSAGERRSLLDKATAGLRYVTATHFSGAQKCTDGKQWGGLDRPGSPGWQSDMWTSTFVSGAWLIWDELDPALRRDIERVLASENDLLLKGEPPDGLWADTKAEENGWCVPGLVLGELMFPTNAHAAAWHDRARDYMMNTLCTEADLADTNLVDGRPVKEWVRGANLQPDYTLENHGFFHPSYVGCSSYFLTQAAMYYTRAGRPVPEAATHHVMDTWRMFQAIILPWGESAYPQGMDWELHGTPFINLYAALGTRGRDRYAARMEQCMLQYMRAWQVMGQGSLAFPGSGLGFTRHAVNAEQLSYGYLSHKIFGPAVRPLTWRAAVAQEEGVWEHPYVQFIVHRTAEKFASFSWKNRIMGMLIPIGESHEDEPFFTVPIRDGFVGSFDLAPRGDAKTTVVEHSWKKTADGFETTGTLLVNGGRLKQTLTMASIGKQTLFYADLVTAVSNVTVRAERGVPVGIENDEISGGKRVVTTKEGESAFEWGKPRHPLGLAGSWANVDGRLGAVMIMGSGMNYTQASKYSPGISVCADTLYGSWFGQERKFKAGDIVARRAVLYFVGVSPKKTAALAQACWIEQEGDGLILNFKQPGGRKAEVRVF